MIWLDVATDGLASVLELGLIETTVKLDVVSEKSWVVKPSGHDEYTDVETEEYLARIPPKVLELHKKNGLLLASLQDGRSEGEVSKEAIKWVLKRESQPHMHGEGCDYDRKFLFRCMPGLNDCFAWHSFDVATLNVLAQEWCGNELPGGRNRERTYRALDDLRRTIGRAKHFRARLMNTYALKGLV